MLLSHNSSSVAVARERINADLTAHGVEPQRIEDTSLVVSELVGNAVRHGHPLPGGGVHIRWWIYPDHVEIAVSDGGAPSVPSEGSLSVSTAGGRGLGIVAHVAEAWGVRREGNDVTTVWAMIPSPQFAGAR